MDGLYDDSYISNVRPYARLDELYPEWTAYRLEKMKREIERMQRAVADATSRGEPVPLEQLDRFAEQQISYLRRTVRQMVSPALVRSVEQRFGVRAIHDAGQTWARVRASPRFHELLPAAMESTRAWEEVSPYLADWHETKAAIERGVATDLGSQHGPFSWDRPVEEYTFGDELLRQGLKEVLLEWLDRTVLLALASEQEQ